MYVGVHHEIQELPETTDEKPPRGFINLFGDFYILMLLGLNREKPTADNILQDQ